MNEPHWDHLIHGHLDDSLTESENAEFESLMIESASARRRFWDLAEVQGLARESARLAGVQAEVEAALPEALHTSPVLKLAQKMDPMATPQQTESKRWTGWLTWRPLTAAAAGLVIGVFCASFAWAYVAPSLGKVITLLQESFESVPAPLVTGVPIEAGKWSGDYTEVVGEQQGVKPESGKKMLRFLRADFEGKVKPEGSYISEVHQLIDLRPYRREFADGGAVVQLSAAFNAFSFPAEEAFVCSVSLQALDAETAINGSTRIGETLLIDCLAMARNSRLKVDRDPATWQRLNAELRLPSNTDFILIRIALAHTNQAQRRESFDGHYLDGVRLTLARREGQSHRQ